MVHKNKPAKKSESVNTAYCFANNTIFIYFIYAFLNCSVKTELLPVYLNPKMVHTSGRNVTVSTVL